MKLKFTGNVYFANGDPVENVSVRIFDKDAPGKEDDDLTITPGLSDERGVFDLTYEPLRYLDYHTTDFSGPSSQPGDDLGDTGGMRLPDLADVYLPYLRFNYTFNGLNYTHTASMGILKTKFFLPENPPVEFLPSMHGFKFVNAFSGYFLPFSTPAFMSSRKVTSTYGLCGGMCASAYDFALARKPIPDLLSTPHQGTKLHRYLFQRQMDSLGGLGQEVVKVAQWTSLPDDSMVGTIRRTADEFVQIRQKLDQRNLVILALIYAHASSLKELAKVIFDNHQVLAYGYLQDTAGTYTIQVYDPNLPGRDDVVIHLEPVLLGEEIPASAQAVLGASTTQLLGGAHYRDLRGFFAMPYTPVKPPKRI